jgi:hypothetical protein
MARTTELISARTPMEPKCFYCCKYYTGQLLKANLLTGELSCLNLPGYLFKQHCQWSELPGGSLLITGGWKRGRPLRKVAKIDTLREWAVSSQPPIHTARRSHAAVYHSQYLYLLGGCRKSRPLSECERFSCAESRWEVLPALPVAGMSMSAVEVENSLYALGGSGLDTVQKLSLDSLTWELMQLKLPQAALLFPCFKTETQVCLVIKDTLYSFTPLQVKPIKAVPEGIQCNSSYYSRGTLYYESGFGLTRLAVGELA